MSKNPALQSTSEPASSANTCVMSSRRIPMALIAIVFLWPASAGAGTAIPTGGIDHTGQRSNHASIRCNRNSNSPRHPPRYSAHQHEFQGRATEVVLDHLCDAAGLIVIKEGQLDGRVTVQSTEPVSPEEAVTLLNTVLKANGFSAIQSGRVVRIMPRRRRRREACRCMSGAIRRPSLSRMTSSPRSFH